MCIVEAVVSYYNSLGEFQYNVNYLVYSGTLIDCENFCKTLESLQLGDTIIIDSFERSIKDISINDERGMYDLGNNIFLDLKILAPSKLKVKRIQEA